jgi:phosphoglycerate kinase
MGFRFLTLDDVEVASKRVLVRVDINSPMKPGTEEIMDDSRFVAILDTLKALEKSKVAILSHQGRPGESDFTSMQPHEGVLKKYLGTRVKFIEDIIGPSAIDAVRKLRNGEVLLLDNARLLSEEVMEGTPELFAKTHLIRRLAPLFDLFVNDAYPAAHRAQASMVGFPEVLMSLAGRSMERELKALNKALYEPDRPSIVVLGGAKVPDKLKILANILERGKVDKVLLGGLMGIVFLEASGIKMSQASRGNLKDLESIKQQAKYLLDKFKDIIMIPKDVAVSVGQKRVEAKVDRIPDNAAVMDIGDATIREYVDQIAKAKTILANGPPGVFENKDFAKGTRQVLEAIAQSKGFSVIGGGHLAVLAKEEKLQDSIGYISTGGGATMAMLAGQKLPGVEALYRAAKRFEK